MKKDLNIKQTFSFNDSNQKAYQCPEFEVIAFNYSDVISTSLICSTDLCPPNIHCPTDGDSNTN